MDVAAKVMTLNACTPLQSSQSVVADTFPLFIEKSGKSQRKVREFCSSFSVATMIRRENSAEFHLSSAESLEAF